MTGFRGWWKRLQFGLPTVLGLAQRGFFIPYRHAGSIARPVPPYSSIEAMFANHADAFAERLAETERYWPELSDIGATPSQPPAPRWRQDWFPRLDAAMAYGLTRNLAPARIVEIGSGHSTRFYARAVLDGGLATVITAIDPAPRADLAGLASVQLRRSVVQAVDSDVFAALDPGDILSIDSSHILMPGSDVDLLLNQVLPALPTGIHVHIHDMFLPDAYPQDWAWRGYNEQLGVATLLNGGGWDPVFSSQYVLTRRPELFHASRISELPLPAGAVESGLWLKKSVAQERVIKD